MDKCRHLIIERYPQSGDYYQCQQCLETFEVRLVTELASFVVDFPKFDGDPESLPKADVLSVELCADGSVIYESNGRMSVELPVNDEFKGVDINFTAPSWLQHETQARTK